MNAKTKTKTKTITVTLHAGNMGDATEADYDAWAAFVAARIDERTGLDVAIEQARYGVCMERDGISDPEHSDIVREALAALWEEFCGTPEAWPHRPEVAS